jgi:hypothetical protein
MFNDVLHHTEYENQDKLIKDALRVSEKVLIFELIPGVFSKYEDYSINKIHNFSMDVPFTYRKPNEWEVLFTSLTLKFERRKVVSPFWYPAKHVAFRILR